MAQPEIAATLLAWTPYLAGGFVRNIMVSGAAMGAGTGIGWVLALLRNAGSPRPQRIGLFFTEFMRNTPTIVFQFYLVMLLPIEFAVPGTALTLHFPGWTKAALALSLAVSGFVSDNLGAALVAAKAGNRLPLAMLLPNWTGYFVLIVLASSSASIIGVDEMIGRCNTVIAVVNDNRMMFWVYAYAMLWYCAFCFTLTRSIGVLSRVLERRLIRTPVAAPEPAH